jgi:hypothetical protein
MHVLAAARHACNPTMGIGKYRCCREVKKTGGRGDLWSASLDKVPDDSIQLAKDGDTQLFFLSRWKEILVLHQL